MYRLLRLEDGLVKQSIDVAFVEFKENGSFKEKHSTIAVGRSLLMHPYNIYYAWLTTTITEILEEKENYWKFKTENSTYELQYYKESE